MAGKTPTINAEITPPAAFQAALAEIKASKFRTELTVAEMPAPQRVAPYACAIEGLVANQEDEVGSGRFVLLYDPKGNPAWDGNFRCVIYARAEIEPEHAADPLLSEVGWSWLKDALVNNSAEHKLATGTVTCVNSLSFTSEDPEESSAQVEIRASWTATDNIAGQVAAWAELLCMCSGLAPLPVGVTQLRVKSHGN